MTLKLTELFVGSETGQYVSFGREYESAYDASFNPTEVTTTVLNSVLGDLQHSTDSLVDVARGLRHAQTWNLYTDPLSLVLQEDTVTVIGSDAVFEVTDVSSWQDHWEFALQLRN